MSLDEKITFSAATLPRLKQGDHDVIVMAYREGDSDHRRISVAIIPERITPMFLALFNSETDEDHLE